MLNRIVSVLVVLAAILMLSLGFRWLVDPAGVAPQFGFALSTGLGLSSQIGDMSGYFLTAGICMLLGLVSKQSIWYYPPVMLLLLTAAGRMTAWFAHGASLAVPMIAVELVVSTILLVAARRLTKTVQV